MKYQFEVDEIKSCDECPCCNKDCDYGDACNLDVEFHEEYGVSEAPKEIPVNCPLVKVGE